MYYFIMEGACVYINSYKNPTLVMYKEYKKDTVLLLTYYNYLFFNMVIDCKTLTNLLPRSSEHILTKLPIFNSLNYTLKEWKIIAREKLIKINYENSKKINTDFYYKFKKNNF